MLHDIISQAGDEILYLLEEDHIKPFNSLLAGLHNINDVLQHVYKSKYPEKVSNAYCAEIFHIKNLLFK